jgi:ankyrin repeat protein
MSVNHGDMAEKVRLLCEAVVLEDRVVGMAWLERLISDGVDLNTKGLGGHVPLEAALWSSHWQAVDRLLDAGAWLRIDSAYGSLACWMLAQAPESIIERFLAGGMEWGDLVEIGDEEDTMVENPIVDLLQESRFARLEWLWDRGLDRLKEVVQPDLGWTPLVSMSAKNDLVGAAWLIGKGVDVNRRGEASNGFTALDKAVMNGDVEMARLLVEAGANPNIPTWMWGTATGRAADEVKKSERGSAEYVRAREVWAVVEPAARRFAKPVYPDGRAVGEWPPRA